MGSRLRQRQRIAIEVARRMAEYGHQDDAGRVRRDVARDLGISDPRALPDRADIEAALDARQRLFGPVDQAVHLQRLRGAAVEAMAALRAFSPRLAGAVLDGRSGPDSVIELHLHSDNADEVVVWLAERGIPASSGQRRMRLDASEDWRAPSHSFSADGLPVTLVVLPLRALHQPPLDHLDGQPMARAAIERVRRLYEGNS